MLATLIYFSIQIRNMQAASLADAFARSEEGERELRLLYIAHMNVLTRANKEENLSEEETALLDQVYAVCQSHHFHAYGRSTTLGRDGGIHALNFARALKENPCFLPIFAAKSLSDSTGPKVRAFGIAVQRFLEQEDT